MRCPDGTVRFRIYVIETSPGSLYVGSTAQPLSERLREHRTGTGHRSHRRHTYIRIRRDLMPKTLCATRERAEGLERRTAERLRARGFDVTQG